MGMDMLRCQSPQRVEKEVGAFLPAYNLIRAALAQAAACAKVLLRQLSFAGAQRVINSFLDLLRTCPKHGLTSMLAHWERSCNKRQIHSPEAQSSRCFLA